MRAILNCSDKGTEWAKEYFDDMSAYMLPVLGKPLIEYYMEYCSLSGIEKALVILHDYDEELAQFLDDGSKWGMSIEITTATDNDSAETMLKKNSNFVNGGNVLFMDGFFMPLYDKTLSVKKTDGAEAAQEEGKPDMALVEQFRAKEKRISVLGGENSQGAFCDVLDIRSIGEFFNLNMILLKSFHTRLFMRGYAAESNVFMGMNNSIPRRAKLIPPVIIGDNVHIENGSSVGPSSIVGDTSIIDKSTHLEEVIVFGRTYIGTDLELKRKILCGQFIIDPEAEVKIMFCDSFFTSKVEAQPVSSFLGRFIEIAVSILLLLFTLPPALIFVVFGKPKSRIISYTTPSGKKAGVRKFEHSPRLRDVWFFKFSQDKLPRLWAVITGKMALIGDSLQTSENGGEFLMHYKFYFPGAFTYADSLGKRNTYEKFIDDLFYRHSRTFKTDLQVVLRSYINHLLGEQGK